MSTKVVEIVTISKKTPLFKDGNEAERIEMINFNFSSGDKCGYNLVAQKDLYQIGDKAVYIQPDYCLSELSIFDTFTKPGGDVKKSRLGKNGRIRALKFNFNLENSTDAVYSFGVLMPLNEVAEFLNIVITEDTDLQELLQIIKYEEPESAGSGLTAGQFPSFMYKTDEPNCENLVDHIERVINEGQEFGIALKHDGSSITVALKKDTNGEYEEYICSRGQWKKTDQTQVVKYTDSNGNVYHKYLNQDTKERGWYCDNTQEFFTDTQAIENNFEPTLELVKDSWVDLARSSGLLERGLEYCKKYDLQLAFRGEIFGAGLKGSGNKLNPDASEKQTLRLFGIDDLSSGFAKRINYSSEHNLASVATNIDVLFTPITVYKAESYDDLIKKCKTIFDKYEAEGKIIEGVVCRTMYTNDASFKVMNPLYDSKK